MEPMGIEPTTSALRTQGYGDASIVNKELNAGDGSACTAACTNNADEGDSDPAGGGFAQALAMIARLPLSDAEKAEAVRRLLAAEQGGSK